MALLNMAGKHCLYDGGLTLEIMVKH